MPLASSIRTPIAALALVLAASAANAVEPDEVLDDPALEARAREVSRELRCVVCQSQNIDDSNAPLAKDMRILVRERLAAGDTDEEVKAFLVERYGEYVLLKPPMREGAILLWLAPALVFAAAAGLAAFHLIRIAKRAESSADLSPEDPANAGEGPK